MYGRVTVSYSYCWSPRNRSSYRYIFPWACHYITVSYRSQYIQNYIPENKQKNNQLILNHSEFYRHTNEASSRWKSSKIAFTDLLSPFCTLETHSYRTLWNRIMRGKSLLRNRMDKSAYIYIKIYIKQQPKNY